MRTIRPLLSIVIELIRRQRRGGRIREMDPADNPSESRGQAPEKSLLVLLHSKFVDPSIAMTTGSQASADAPIAREARGLSDWT